MGSSNPTPDELKELYVRGLKQLVSLLDPSEQKTAYSDAEARSIGYTLHNIPVRDFTAPSAGQFAEFLELVDNGSPTLLHCQGGSGRTGTFAVAYWIAKGVAPKDAVARVRESNPRAVETQEQLESLASFARSRHGSA